MGFPNRHIIYYLKQFSCTLSAVVMDTAEMAQQQIDATAAIANKTSAVLAPSSRRQDCLLPAVNSPLPAILSITYFILFFASLSCRILIFLVRFFLDIFYALVFDRSGRRYKQTDEGGNAVKKKKRTKHQLDFTIDDDLEKIAGNSLSSPL